ncbi:ABC-2 type transporter-domain-containing protein [Dendryphion nanum]|uniref:ABC-2 type transporter-domain-containing protein n=1 Tax=Dendryphion nanum TaxID=256645 RepID=A0A9P9EG05_9PLEO|nr:ABC-2 type transporter-domain-containing protein [Dendryphion nanum]
MDHHSPRSPTHRHSIASARSYSHDNHRNHGSDTIGSQIIRTLTQRSTYSERDRERDAFDTEEADEPEAFGDWQMANEVKEINARNVGQKPKRLGVTWKNLTVKGVGQNGMIHENFLSQFNIPQKIKESRQPSKMRTILDKSHGCVKPGEMLLVVGRPGAGCTTLLKLLANKRAGFAEIEGDVQFGNLSSKDASKYRGQIVMNTEDEIFFPTLTVAQTMDFATKMKIPDEAVRNPSNEKEYQEGMRDFLLRSMGIEHTFDTKVGNEYVRGVSGGERKRVSIIECMATRGSVFCWDNSTRGLDASTALEWSKALRAMTTIMGLTTIATLYQAGNGIFEQFDKVLVLDEGKEIFYGPREEARPFMEKLGFLCDDAANVGDFLTGVTVASERTVKEGFETSFPRTAVAVRESYERSDIYQRMQSEYSFPDSDATKSSTNDFIESVAAERSKHLSKNSQFTVPLGQQVKTAIRRQYQILWGDRATFVIKQAITIILSLVSGSLFYDAPNSSAGLFVKGGALFVSILSFGLMAMSEVTDSFTGRPVLAKHKEFALYHPAAFCLAQITADIPIIASQVTTFSLILYFMVGLKQTAGAFFTFWVVLFSLSICMTALFRLVGAAFQTFDDASKVSGFLVSALIMYSGYMIPKSVMHPWFVWIYWIDPLAYGFEALMANEFKGQTIACVIPNIIPAGPGYESGVNSACAGIAGAAVGANSLTGEEYLASLSYTTSHLWRNFGILWAWWVLFAVLTVYFTSNWKNTVTGGGSLLIPRENVKRTQAILASDEESQVNEKGPESSDNSVSTKVEQEANTGEGENLVRNESVFTWKNLTYTVKTPSGDRVLLDNVQGWIKPGMLGALMGSSGAGKTTLMDVLAQRKTEGTIHGSILVDGRPLPVSFQRSAGYCEQLDVHEPYSTVREALEFSALLRQPGEVPREEKIRYVDTVIDLLELHDLEHTLIGRPGAGLSVEQRKRVTIGVELVAKPSILIFLDEPTSGLDGQSAFNTLRFLRKLSAAGQAVLCTIHQPSAQLFAQFDTLLLLTKGGKTVYFGDIGENAATIKDYFGRNGAPCPPAANPAEHMIDVVSGSLSQGRDWNKVWLESPEHSHVTEELDRIVSEAASNPPKTNDDGKEFATDIWTQTKIVTNRMNVSLYRNNDYINNKMALHIGSALFNGFSFWMIGSGVADLQLALFANFNFIFVAPGVFAQLQPLFIERRDIYEAREKKSKMYSWAAFVTGLIVSEFPYLILCAVLYFVCFYYTVGFPSDSSKAGAVFFIMLIYEFIYTGIGQFVAAYAPNAIAASLINPIVITMLVSFCGVLVPYSQIQSFWRYWMYYLNPFTYLMGGLLNFTLWDKQITCKESEFAIFDPPSGQTCADYLSTYLMGFGQAAELTTPNATSQCKVCQYSQGSDYLNTINITKYSDGWRDIGLCILFAFSSYGLVYALMKLRTKTSKKAE